MKVWFGSYDDTEIADLSTEYLHWLRYTCAQQPPPSSLDGPVVQNAKRKRWYDFLSAVEAELIKRGE